jgi:hypothetical protein
MELFVDNKSAIDLAYNPEHHQRTKHIARRHFYIRDLVEDLDDPRALRSDGQQHRRLLHEAAARQDLLPDA